MFHMWNACNTENGFSGSNMEQKSPHKAGCLLSTGNAQAAVAAQVAMLCASSSLLSDW